MNNISEKIARSFLNDQPIKQGATQVESCKGVTMLFLYNAAVVTSTTVNGRKHIQVNDCGYRTQLTKEIINAVLRLLGLDLVTQKKGVWYWGDKVLKENINSEVVCLTV